MNLGELERALFRARLEGMSQDDEIVILTPTRKHASGSLRIVRMNDGARVVQITTAEVDEHDAT
jgi:hypothetical protein